MKECPFTPRELECVKWFSQGHMMAEVAEFIGYRPSTVNNDMRKAKDKTGAATVTGLVAMALRNKWIQ